MASDKRITLAGQPVSFTCQNYRYRTDISKGFSSGVRTSKGSVFEMPLAQNSESASLWLEHVTNDSGDTHYWFMWYDAEGKPTIPMSGILDRENIADMSRLLATFMP